MDPSLATAVYPGRAENGPSGQASNAATKTIEICMNCRHAMSFHRFGTSQCFSNGCGCSEGVSGPRRPGLTRSITRGGYVRISGLAEHPLADGGQVFEHRAVLYADLGPGEHLCHWCPKPVRWEDSTLYVDHLDDDRKNNDLQNLVPSCFVCNINRGKGLSAAA